MTRSRLVLQMLPEMRSPPMSPVPSVLSFTCPRIPDLACHIRFLDKPPLLTH
jgi:hypothetical protein